MFGKQTCQKCNTSLDRNASFCRVCGTPTNARMGKCPYCSKKTNLDSKYCAECGRELGTQREPAVKDRVWRASLDDFAVRLDPKDVAGRFYKHIEIQPGQQAIILVDGRVQEERRGPGTYTVETLFDNLLNLGHGHRVRALVVQGGPMPIIFELKKLRTADDFEVSGQCEVAVEVVNPAIFFAHTMRQQQAFTTSDLRKLLFKQVNEAVSDVIRKMDMRSLATSWQMKQTIDASVDRHLSQTLAASGLRVVEVRTAEFAYPRYDAVRGVWEEIRIRREEIEADTTLAVEQKQAELDKRKRLFEVEQAEEGQITAEEREKVRVYEERAEVWEHMRQAVMSERANKIRSDEDFADFLAEIDERKVLRKEELDILKEEYANRREDRHAARAQIAYLAGLERDYERKRAALLQRTDFTLEDMAASLKVAQQKLVDAGLLTEQRWQDEQAELLRKGERDDWKRSEQRKWEDFEKERETATAKHRRELATAQQMHDLEMQAIHTDAELTDAQKRARGKVELTRYKKQQSDIQREIEGADFDERMRQKALLEAQEQKEIENDLKLAEQAQAMMAENRRRKDQDKLDAEKRAREMAREDDLARQQATHDQAVEQRRLDLEHEAEARKQAHELGMFQAKGVTESEKIRAHKDMTPDQILATKVSSDAGEVLKEKYRAQKEENMFQAKGVTESEKIRAHKDMTPDQILATKVSSDAGEVLKEKYKAQNEGKMSERENERSDRLLEKQEAYTRSQLETAEANAKRQREASEEAAKRQQEMSDGVQKTTSEMLKSVTEVAKAFAGNQPQPQSSSQAPNVIVVPGGGGSTPQVIQTGGGGVSAPGSSASKVQVCPNCSKDMEVGIKFCSNCSHQFHK